MIRNVGAGRFAVKQVFELEDVALEIRELREQGQVEVLSRRIFIDDVLAGLGHAHAMGIVHRDIKPQNLLIDDEGRVKVADFGIAKQTGDATLAQTGFLVGTPAYVSPEQAIGQPVDGRRNDGGLRVSGIGLRFARRA